MDRLCLKKKKSWKHPQTEVISFSFYKVFQLVLFIYLFSISHFLACLTLNSIACMGRVGLRRTLLRCAHYHVS